MPWALSQPRPPSRQQGLWESPRLCLSGAFKLNRTVLAPGSLGRKCTLLTKVCKCVAVGLESPPLSVSEERQLAILTELPFVVPFEERVKVCLSFSGEGLRVLLFHIVSA